MKRVVSNPLFIRDSDIVYITTSACALRDYFETLNVKVRIRESTRF